MTLRTGLIARRATVLGLAALALAACDQTPDALAPAPAPPRLDVASPDDARIGPGVLEATRSGDDARIVVALHVPPLETAAGEATAGGAAGRAPPRQGRLPGSRARSRCPGHRCRGPSPR